MNMSTRQRSHERGLLRPRCFGPFVEFPPSFCCAFTQFGFLSSQFTAVFILLYCCFYCVLLVYRLCSCCHCLASTVYLLCFYCVHVVSTVVTATVAVLLLFIPLLGYRFVSIVLLLCYTLTGLRNGTVL